MQKERGNENFKGVSQNDLDKGVFVAEAGEVPVGRSLETTKFQHENNFFARRGNQKLFVWGAPWSNFKEYDSLVAIPKELLGIEKGSREDQIEFFDSHSLDLRIPADAEQLLKDCYPKGSVPGVRLGTYAPNEKKP
jgi:hypothetical protein